jgi:multiple sugar transport system permease protein
VTSSTLVALGVFTFVTSWNDFTGPLVVLRSVKRYTLPIVLRSMQDPRGTEWTAIMLGMVLALIPLAIVVVLSFRQIVAAITTAVRGAET